MIKYKGILVFIRHNIIPSCYRVITDINTEHLLSIQQVLIYFNDNHPTLIFELSKLTDYGSSFVFNKKEISFKKIYQNEEEENIWKNPEIYFKGLRDEQVSKQKKGRGFGLFFGRGK